jgi:hypothetical protein
MINFYKTILFFVSFYSILSAQAANELYVNGQAAAIPATSPTLYNNGALIYVNGDITIQDGLFVNTGTAEVELTGNWTNNQPGGNNKYQSTGTERFSGSVDQSISGNMAGTSGNDNQFYNLYIKKSNATGEYVSLLSNTHINAAGTLNFESSNGIIRTQAASAGTSNITSTGNYSFYLYVQNPSTSAIIGHSTGSGASTKYIEGKLKRQVNAASTYYFPVGVNKNYLGGMNAFDIKFNSVPTATGILAYINGGTQNLVDPDVFADVAQVDNNPGSINYFSTCIGPPDGIYDWIKLTEKISHQWNLTPDLATSYDYDITVYPSSTLEGTASFYTVPCSPNYTIQYLARNGIPGGNLATYQPGAGFGNEIGYFINPTGKTLPGQTSFSNFRLWGTTDANTALPVELIALYASPVNNQSINVHWKTASEFNNAGFEIERSTDGIHFTAIGWVAGSGSKSGITSYDFTDNQNIQAGTIYYYRLKQVDIDTKYVYSKIVTARIDIFNSIAVSELYPNPTNGLTQIDIISAKSNIVSLSIYDVLGKTIQTNNERVNAGLNIIRIETGHLPAGNYIIQLQSENDIYSKKLIKN